MTKDKKTKKGALHHFHFSNTNEFIIFMIWGLFVTVFLLGMVQ